MAAARVALLSFPKHNDRWRTGFLAGEAALNSLVTVEALKYSLGRERPYQGNGAGDFFQGGTSFESEHAGSAWSVAGVLAHRIPWHIPEDTGLRNGIRSVSSDRGRRHFPFDFLIGSAMGYLTRRIFTAVTTTASWRKPWESPHDC